MNLLLQNKPKNIFLHKDSRFNIEENINIILSPELYWVREFSIPAKSEKEALRFIPSFFEDVLLEDREYKYHAIKLEDGIFLSFAYDTELLKEVINRANINISQIVNIYFGQFELENFESFSIDEKTFYYENGILLKLPKNVKIESRRIQNFEDIKLSSQKLKFDLYPKWLQSNTLYTVVFLLFLVSTINFIKTYSLKQNINEFENKKTEFIKAYTLPTSIIQLRSIVKNNEKEVQKLNKHKEILSYLLDYKKTSNDLKFLSVKYNPTDVSIELKSKNKKEIEKYKSYIVKQYKTEISNKKHSYTIRIKL